MAPLSVTISNKLRKLLAEEKKKVGGENARLGETHALFEQIYLDYNTTMESVKQAQHEKRMKVSPGLHIIFE